MSKPGPDRAEYAISLNGAGDQVARSAHDSPNVMRRTFKPSVSITQICGEPDRSDVNAICVPVGDHVGVDVRRGVVRQAAHARAVAVHDVDLRIAVALRHERDAVAVGRIHRA